ncbi:hypothetical protein CAOG_02697 [Capsaspora owczarzaki ATCC 30864]|uniref:hypothetical protein n=1 Tax=Capsaspora owczarzaki (strain ATCC 30864) TaxID=595528 RepID=UPI0003520DAB|nr:hypothetical protein CAOG_02697 [Capsaspora owczarzaki ATCC 30864]|eukprot:XP_004349447.2 hypothetical protein CAOG_02697 [Capsaspora owczarzaki ATCC 30864]
MSAVDERADLAKRFRQLRDEWVESVMPQLPNMSPPYISGVSATSGSNMPDILQNPGMVKSTLRIRVSQRVEITSFMDELIKRLEATDDGNDGPLSNWSALRAALAPYRPPPAPGSPRRLVHPKTGFPLKEVTLVIRQLIAPTALVMALGGESKLAVYSEMTESDFFERLGEESYDGVRLRDAIEFRPGVGLTDYRNEMQNEIRGPVSASFQIRRITPLN